MIFLSFGRYLFWPAFRRHIRRAVFLAVLVCLAAALPAAAAPAFMNVDEIRPGMRGIGKTVVSGTKIEEFGVEVLGVMKQKGPAGDLILVRTFGDLIDRTGGIAEGMSGSPVYIDGKLVGAIAYGWPMTDHRIGMVTPIGDMLKLLKPSAPAAASPAASSSSASTAPGDASPPDDAAPPAENENAHAAALDLKATPLMASGFGPGALAMLKEKLGPLHLVPMAVGDAPEDLSSQPLEPGSAVGVQLIRGDVSLGALGTVTYVDGDKVLAFGHPFLRRGKTDFFLTNAYVFATVNGLQNSFKVGTTGEAVGRVSQDRGAGIAGEVGMFPSVIPVTVTVKDETTGKERELLSQVVHDDQLGPLLSAVTVFNSIEKVTDRTGPGTARVTFAITAKDMPGETLVRDNMFYSPQNIGETAVGELNEVLATLMNNQFNPVEIMDVRVKVAVDASRRSADIVDARPDHTNVRPGDKVNIEVKLKPFRDKVITRTVPYIVPKDQPAGPMTLGVRGGGVVTVAQLLQKLQAGEAQIKPEHKKRRTFKDLVNDLADRDRNNDIVVEIASGEQAEQGKSAAQESVLQAGQEPQSSDSDSAARPAAPAVRQAAAGSRGDENQRKFHLTTDYIITGSTQISLNVVAAKQ